MDFSIILESIDIYIEGLKNTVFLVSIALIIGLLMAVPMAIIRTSKNIVLQAPVRAFVYFFRGTPLLVQLFIIYYGLGQFEAVTNSFLWSFLKEAYICALVAFSLNTCAYTTEIFRGAIETTPHGEIEAAKAAGILEFGQDRFIVETVDIDTPLPPVIDDATEFLPDRIEAGTYGIDEETGEPINPDRLDAIPTARTNV